LLPSNLSNCSFLRAACLECHGLFDGTSPWVCFHDQQPLLFNSGFFLGSCTGILVSAWSETLEPIPATLSATSGSSFRCTAWLCHIEPLVHCYCPSYMGVNAFALQCHFLFAQS
jgi:hypothetical protein